MIIPVPSGNPEQQELIGEIFHGNPEQQELASEILRIMRLQGQFFAGDAPIRQTLTHLADFFSAKHQCDHNDMAQKIDAALQENHQLFRREEEENDIIYITSRTGTYRTTGEDTSHSFRQRFYEPDQPLPIDDLSVVISTSRPVLTSVEPVFISDYWQEQAEYASVPAPTTRPPMATGDEAEDDDSVTEPTTHDTEEDDALMKEIASLFAMGQDDDTDETTDPLAGLALEHEPPDEAAPPSELQPTDRASSAAEGHAQPSAPPPHLL